MQDAALMTTTDRPDGIPMFKTGQALESLRDSGYNLPTALAEVVDNSIEADANRIFVELQEGENERRKKCVHRIAVGDDGDGMDEYTLHHYLEIGFSTRWMRTDTIGKYGVGAKLAALNFARRIDVWSRTSDEEPWRHVYFDLDEARKLEDEGHDILIAAPVTDDVPGELAHLLTGERGTLVVWSNVDRLEHGRVAASFNELLLEVQKEASRIFRHFIDGAIEIRVNDTRLLAHDPLFLMEGTWADKVLSEYQARQSGEKPSKSSMRHFHAVRLCEEKIKVKGSEALLRITLYPPEVTRKRGQGGDELAKSLRVPENQGAISFVRMNREVSYTNVPRIFPFGIREPDRHIGIEVSFKPDLDDFFGIRNVKRGVEPHGELREKIRSLLRKYIAQARSMLEERWGQVAKEDREHEGEHAPVTDAAKDVDKVMPKGRAKGPESPEEKKSVLEDLAEDAGHADSEEEKEEYIERIKNLPFVVESVNFPGNMFIDVQHLDGQVIVRVNTRHRFYREMWEPLRSIASRDAGSVSGEEAVTASRRATEALGLMVIAYGKAQSMHEDPQVYKDLTMYWGQFLDTLMHKVKDVV